MARGARDVLGSPPAGSRDSRRDGDYLASHGARAESWTMGAIVKCTLSY